MPNALLSPQEFRVWHAFQIMGAEVLSRVGRDLSAEAGISGPEFAVLSRVAGIGKGQMRQQALAECMGWDKSRLSHQITRMQQRGLVERHASDGRIVTVVLTLQGRKTLEAAAPIHAESVRRNLLARLSKDQTATLVRISNILGDDDWLED